MSLKITITEGDQRGDHGYFVQMGEGDRHFCFNTTAVANLVQQLLVEHRAVRNHLIR